MASRSVSRTSGLQMSGSGTLSRNRQPWGTSSYCSRCGLKDRKAKTLNDFTKDPKGRVIHCPACHCIADRDYLGALNVYRVFELNQQNNEILPIPSPLLYQSNRTPAPRLSGRPLLVNNPTVYR
ncbi:MAG: zinc ribbon domain-containing protein [Candidatus Hodarchaeota archaeon]